MESGRRHRIPTRYTQADIELLAQVDEAHETDVTGKFFTSGKRDTAAPVGSAPWFSAQMA